MVHTALTEAASAEKRKIKGQSAIHRHSAALDTADQPTPNRTV
ncbi:hypothetical protein [Nocardia tengchongensis]